MNTITGIVMITTALIGAYVIIVFVSYLCLAIEFLAKKLRVYLEPVISYVHELEQFRIALVLMILTIIGLIAISIAG